MQARPEIETMHNHLRYQLYAPISHNWHMGGMQINCFLKSVTSSHNYNCVFFFIFFLYVFVILCVIVFIIFKIDNFLFKMVPLVCQLVVQMARTNLHKLKAEKNILLSSYTKFRGQNYSIIGFLLVNS